MRHVSKWLLIVYGLHEVKTSRQVVFIIYHDGKLLFNLALKYARRMIQETNLRLDMNSTHQVLDMPIGDDIRATGRNADVLLNACKVIGSAVNIGKTEYIGHHWGMMENGHITRSGISYEKVKTFIYLDSLLTKLWPHTMPTCSWAFLKKTSFTPNFIIPASVWWHLPAQISDSLTQSPQWSLSIHFTWHISSFQVNFPDIIVCLDQGHSHLVHIKPTNCQYLHFSSCHLSSTKYSIPFSQTIYSHPDDLHNYITNLGQSFFTRDCITLLGDMCTAPGIILLSPLIISDQCDWCDTRGKWHFARNSDRSCWHCHTSVKLFWPQPMAPWTPNITWSE